MNHQDTKTTRIQKHNKEKTSSYFPIICAYLRHLRIIFLVSLCLGGLQLFALADGPKPEVKSVSVMGFRAGHTTTATIYGENLAPKEVSVNKPPVKVRLLEVKPTEEKMKAKGSRQVTVEVTVPADCPRDTFDLTLMQPDGAKADVPLPVVEDAAVEVTVKKPASTFENAMPLPGPSVAITGTLDGDTADVFRAEMKAGETWEISLLAGRAGSSLDPVLRVRNNRHVSLALSVGEKKKDRHIAFHPPMDGTYYIELTEAEARGGGGFDYRLTVIRKN